MICGYRFFLLAPVLNQKKKLIIWQKVSKSVIVVQQKLVAYSHRKVLCLNILLLDA